MNYYRRHIGDYLRDTSHLSLLEHGVYTRLLDVYYTREGAIPEAEAARLVGARTSAECAALKSVLKEFFRSEQDGWHQGRCDEEIAIAGERSELARASAKRRWEGRHRKVDANALPTHCEGTANGYANALPTHCEGNALHPPSPNSPTDPKTDPPDKIPVGPQAAALSSEPHPGPEPDSAGGSLDQALFAEARKIFGASIGGQINRAIKARGKPWVVEQIERCRRMDPEQARAFLAAAIRPAQRPQVVT